MIESFVNAWDARKGEIEAKLCLEHPEGYSDIVKMVVEILSETGGGYESYTPDPDNIRAVDFGHYQGTTVYVIPSKGYQPSSFWCTAVEYGSCSGCDTFAGIYEMSDSKRPTSDQVREYMLLALHILQNIKQV